MGRAVAHWQVPPYVLPAPSAVARAFLENFVSLMAALAATLTVSLGSLPGRDGTGCRHGHRFFAKPPVGTHALSLCRDPAGDAGGRHCALILIWVGFERINLALVIIATIVAFFPILAGATLGLKSADFNLIDLARLYGASRAQILWRIRLPTSLPYLLSGMKTAGGLALIGAVVAEFVARQRHRNGTGLAHRGVRQPAGDRHPVRGFGPARRRQAWRSSPHYRCWNGPCCGAGTKADQPPVLTGAVSRRANMQHTPSASAPHI